MATISPTYTTAQTITMPAALQGLGATDAVQSSTINNGAISPVPFLDALVSASITATSAPTAGGTVSLYLAVMGDAGNLPDGATGTDGTYTPLTTINLPLLGTYTFPNNAGPFTTPSYSVAAANGGIMPDEWMAS